jgi:uncharacterized membrane protein
MARCLSQTDRMSARWERLDELPPETAPAVMDALLTPHRSLRARSFLILMCLFSVMNAAVAVFFALNGAWPVLFFLALDVVLLTVAFRMNFRSARMFERVRVAAGRLVVTHAPVRGRARHWMVSAHWARVEDGPDAVRIAAGGRALSVGRFLSPPERGDFATALRRALSEAR